MELPDWFKLTPGFRWFDTDGDLCVLLGWEPESEVRTGACASTTTEGGVARFFVELAHAPSMTFVTWYKGSWLMRDLETEDLSFEGAEPCPDDHPILARLMNKDTFKHMDKDSA